MQQFCFLFLRMNQLKCEEMMKEMWNEDPTVAPPRKTKQNRKKKTASFDSIAAAELLHSSDLLEHSERNAQQWFRPPARHHYGQQTPPPSQRQTGRVSPRRCAITKLRTGYRVRDRQPRCVNLELLLLFVFFCCFFSFVCVYTSSERKRQH